MAFSADVSVALKTIPAALRKLQGAACRVHADAAAARFGRPGMTGARGHRRLARKRATRGRRVAWAAQAPALSPKRRQIDGRRRHPLAPRGLGPTQAPHRPHGCDCPEMLGGGRREEAALQGAGRPSGERIGRQSALIYAYGYICTAHGTMW